MKEILRKNKNKNLEYIPLSKAGYILNISRDYMNVLVRRGKFEAVKLGRNWFTTAQWIEDYREKPVQSNDNYIPLSKAGHILNTSRDYLNVLIRRGKLRALKLGRNWFTTGEWLNEYQRTVGHSTLPKTVLEKLESEEKSEIKNLKSKLVLESTFAILKRIESKVENISLAKDSKIKTFKDFEISKRVASFFASREIELSSRKLESEEKSKILESAFAKVTADKAVEEFQKVSRQLGILKSLKSWSHIKLSLASGLVVILLAVSLGIASGLINFSPLAESRKAGQFSIDNFKASIFSDVFKNFPSDLPSFSQWLASGLNKSISFFKSKSPSELAIETLESGKSKLLKPEESPYPINTLAEAEALDSGEAIAPAFAEAPASKQEGEVIGGGILISGSEFKLLDNRLSIVETDLKDQTDLINSELSLQKKTILGTLEALFGIAKLVPEHPISAIVVQGQPATLTTYSIAPQVNTGFDRLSANYFNLANDAVINGALTVKSGATLNSLSVSGNTGLAGDATIGGTLTVIGDTTLGNLTISGIFNAPTGQILLGNASTTNLTVSGNLWATNGTITNASTTYATLPTFWGTNGTITNASSTYLTVSDTAWFNNLTVSGTTNITGPGFITSNASSTYLTISDTAWINKLNVTNTTSTSTITGGLTVGNNAALSVDRNAAANSLFIDPSGNVGIGTTSPTVALDVSGSNTSNSQLRVGNLEFQPYALNNSWFGDNIYYNGGFKYRNTGYGTLFYMFNGDFEVRTVASGTAGATATPVQHFIVTQPGNVGIGGNQSVGTITGSALTVLNTGNVGIGTIAPNEKLEASGASVAVRLTDTDTAGVGRFRFYENTTNIGDFQFVGSTHPSTGERNWMEFVNRTTTGGLSFWTNSTQQMSINSSGTVGIGTMSPTAGKLHIVGGATNALYAITTSTAVGSHYGIQGVSNGANSGTNIGGYFSATGATTNYGLLVANGNVGIGTTTPNNLLTLAAITTPALGFTTNTGLSGWTMGIDTADANKFKIASSTAGVGTNPRLTIDGNGNVGIGTTTPTQALTIQGNQFIYGGLGVGIATTTNGVIQTSGDVSVGGNFYVSGNSAVVGGSSANTLTINSSINSHLIPDQSIVRDLGSTEKYWRSAYIGTLTVNSISAASTTIGGTQSATFTINSDNATQDNETGTLIFFRGLIEPNALLTWNAATSSKRFEFNQVLYINNGSASTSNPTLTVQTIPNQTANGFQVLDNSTTTIFSVNPVSSNTTMVNASTTYATLPTFWSTNGTITNLTVNSGTVTNASSTYFTVSDTAWINKLNVTNTTSTSTITGGLTVGNNAALSVDRNAAANSLFIAPSGNVGIGTASPGAKLDVGGSSSVYSSLLFPMAAITSSEANIQTLQLQNTLATNGAETRLIVAANDGSHLSFGIASTGTTNTALFGLAKNTYDYLYSWGGNGASRDLAIGTYDNENVYLASNNVVRMTILNGGNVGIGTTNPTGKLHLDVGTGYTQSLVLDLSSENANPAFRYSSINFNVYTTGLIGQFFATGGSYVNASVNIPANSIGLFAEANAGTLVLGAGGASGDMRFNTGGYGLANERMRILSNGNVGIGTTTPNNILTIHSDTTPALGITTNDGTSGWVLGIDTADANKFKIASSSSSLTSNTRLTIDGNGRVGIGTTTPGSLLSVHSSGNVYFGGNLTVSGTTNLGNISLTNASTTYLTVSDTAWINNGVITNASTTYVTLPTFWGTNGTITNASTTYLSIATNGWLNSNPIISNTTGSQTQLAAFSGTNTITPTSTIGLSLISGLGTMATQNANAVAITGGTISGISTLSATNGTITNASTTYATLPTFWSTTGTIGTLTLTNALTVANGGTGATTLTGILQGNGTSAITGVTGTTGWFPYFNSANTILATSTIFVSTASNVGIGTVSPDYKLDVEQITAGSITSAMFNNLDYTAGNRNAIKIRQQISAGASYSAFLGVDQTSGSVFLSDDSIAANHLTVSSTGNVGVGTLYSGLNLFGSTGDISGTTLHVYKTGGAGNIVIEGDPSILIMGDLGGGANDKGIMFEVDGGVAKYVTLTDAVGTQVDNVLVMDLGTGYVGMGVTGYSSLAAIERLMVDGPINAMFYKDFPRLRAIVDHIGNAGGAYIAAQGANYTTTGSGDITFWTGDTNSADGNTDAVLTEKMRIKYNGYVGIGNTSPSQKLNVQGNVTAQNFTATSTSLSSTFPNASSTYGTITTLWSTTGTIGTLTLTNALTVANGGTGATTLTGLLQGNGTSAITGVTGTTGWFPYFNSANTILATSTIFVSTASNVGIGTTAPLSKLSINGGLHVGGDSDAGDNNILADGTISAATGSNGGFRSTTYTAGQNLIWAFADATGFGFSYNQGGTDDIRFHFGNFAQPQFLISSAGRVGIGTTTPNALLTISGATTPAVSLTTNTGQSGWIYGIDTADANKFKIASSTSSLSTNTRLTINGNGNVGIGTASPGANLEVYGVNVNLLVNGSNQAIVTIKAPTTNRPALTEYAQGSTSYWDAGILYNEAGNSKYSIGTSQAFADAKLTIQSDGNVGIGIASPGVKLDVYNSTGEVAQQIRNDAGTLQLLAQSDGSGWIGTATSDNLYFGTNNAAKMTIDTSGNVGINITSPAAKLHTEYSDTGTISTASVGFNFVNTDQTANNMVLIGFGDNTGTQVSAGKIGAVLTDHTNNYGDLIFINRGTAGLTEKMRILADGNVGIGTASPDEKLEVAGDIHVSGVGNGIYFDTTGAESGNSITVTDYLMTLLNNRGNSAKLVLGNDALTLGTTGAPSMLYVDTDNGNIGIGTTTPNALLTISGATTPAVSLTTNTGQSGWIYGIDTADANKFKIASSTSSLSTNTRLTIDGNGNVGIGTVTPYTTLQVKATSNDRDILTISGLGTAGTYMNFDETGIKGWSIGIDNGDTKLKIREDNYAGTVAMTIDADDNVGIGTSPTAGKLHIVGGTTDALYAITTSTAVGSHYGIQGVSNGVSVTTGTNIGGYFSATGGATANYGLLVANGNVGIGTVSPDYKLEVIGGLYVWDGSLTAVSSPANYIASPNVNNVVALEVRQGRYDKDVLVINSNQAMDSAANLINANENGTSRFVVRGNGNVGIGTTSPSFPLDVQSATGDVRIKSTTGTTFSILRINNTGGDIYFGRENSAGGGSADLLAGDTAYATVLASTGTYPIQFGVNNAVAMTILNGGNVGIGTVSPDEKLEVAGNLSLDYNNPYIYWSANVLNLASKSNVIPIVDLHGSASYNSRIRMYNAGDAAVAIYLDTDPSGASYFNAGNVGIGTTAPLSKLSINGGLHVGGDSDAGDNNLLVDGTVNAVTGYKYNGTATSGNYLRGDGTNFVSSAIQAGDVPTLNQSTTGSAYYVTSRDTRTVNDLPQDYGSLIKFDFKANTTNGLSDGGTYNGVMTWRKYGGSGDFSGGPALQLGYSDNGNLWTRLSTSATTWGTWYKLWNQNNDGTGSGLDADVLDSIDSGSFLRSDASDSYTSGTLTFDAATALDLNTTSLTIADTAIAFDGASTDFAFTGNWTVNTDDLVVIKSTGNVGIASTSPSAVLSVNVSNATGNTAALNINSATSSLLYVRSDGNVGIGTTGPLSKLSVGGVGNSLYAIYGNGTYGVYGDGTYGVYGAGTSYGVYGNGPSATGVYGAGSTGIYGSGSTYGVYGDSGDTGVFGQGVTCDIYGNTSGCLSPPSSIRWKNNIKPLENSLDKVLNLRGVSFDYDQEHGGQHDIGMIAEEVGKIIPEVVIFEEDGVYAKGINYSRLTVVLTEAIKELNANINNIASTTVFLQNQVNALIATSTLQAKNGTIDLTTLNSDLNLNGFSLLNVKSITGMNGLWKIDESGNITAQSVQTQALTIGGGNASGVTIYDRETTAPKCIYIEGGVIKTSDGACGATTNAGTAAAIITASSPIPMAVSPELVSTSTPIIIATTTPTTAILTATTTPIAPVPTATTTPVLTATTTPVIAPASEPVIVSTTTPETATTTP